MTRADDKGIDLARLFTLVHRGTPGDVDFYVEAVRGCALVLELGCGAGRVLGPVAASGTPIVGLERSAAMVAAGRDRWLANLPAHARVVLGDMRSFDLRDRFDAVIVPYNSLFALETDDDVRRTLECARRHLMDGGRLLLDCYALEEGISKSGDGGQFVRVGTFLDQGRRVEVQECEGDELPGRRFAIRYRYRVHRQGDAPLVVEDQVKHHYVPPGLLVEMIEASGFTVEAVHGDFSRQPVDDDSVIRVIEARVDRPPTRATTRVATVV